MFHIYQNSKFCDFLSLQSYAMNNQLIYMQSFATSDIKERLIKCLYCVVQVALRSFLFYS